jgi:S1-C subfamily serine protease
MYRVSLKQLAMLALSSALITGVIVACVHRAVEKGNISVEPVVIADPSVATEEQNNIEIYRKISPGVVFITTRGYSEGLFGLYPSQGSGSGSIIDQEGHILTNYHVVQGAREVEVQIENDRYPAQIVGNDRDNDLAIIKIDAPRGRLTVVPLGASKGLQVGQKVLAIGYPFGLQRTLTTGIISGLERPLYDSAARRTIEGTIQTDASINPGNSGGPLLNARGEMIGINTAIYSQSGGSIGIGFAVPVDIANKIIPEIIAKGYVSRPWLGASTFPLTRRIARAYSLPVSQGVIVSEIYRGSGAAAAGLRPAVLGQNFWGDPVLQQLGDVIVSVNGQAVATNEDIYKAIKDKRPGQTVEVEVIRGGRQVTLALRLSERPPDTQ